MKPLIAKIFTVCCFVTALNAVKAEERGLHRKPLSAVTKEGESISLYEQSHALLIGVSDYTDGWSDLGSIPKELDSVQAALEKQHFNVVRVTNPSGRELKAAFEDFIDEYGYDEENRLLFFFSGHGHSDESNRHGFLVPSDAPLPSKKKDFRRRALDMNQIMAWSRTLDAKHALFLFDSCFSGTVFKAKNIPSENERYIRGVTGKPVRQFITAGSAGETVPAKSTFTPAFVDAIDHGAGDLNGDGYITGSELGMHLSQTIPQHVDQNPQYGKIRDYDLSQGDFVFFSNQKSKPIVAEVSMIENENSLAGNLELVYWQSAEKAGTLRSFEAYHNKYPNGVFADLARHQIANLRSPDVVSVEPPDAMESSDFDVVTKKLGICSEHLQNNRLTTGTGGNALDCYKSILVDNDENEHAIKGLASIENRYFQLAKRALEKGDVDRATVYATRMARVNPSSTSLRKLMTQLEEEKKEDVQMILMQSRRKK